MQKWIILTIGISLLGGATDIPPQRCLLDLQIVTDPGFWVNGARAKGAFGLSGLTGSKKHSLVGGTDSRRVVIGRVYSYLASLEYDPKVDSRFRDLREKRIEHARDLLHEIDLPAWAVTEIRLSNDVHAFVGFSGHYLKVFPDGRMTKGNLHRNIHDITEEMLLSNSLDEEVFDLENY